MPTYYISHGGGPWPWVPQMRQAFSKLEASLVAMVDSFPERPSAILMVSSHWEADEIRITSADRPGMVYDYNGFPPHTYEIVYPAPGAPALSERAAALIAGAGIPSLSDPGYGYDHATFAPMAVMYPEANIPLVQISILRSFDPAQHFAIGRALAPLRDEGVAIIGSGLSFHNVRLFGAASSEPSAAFDKWIAETLALPSVERENAMLQWERAPFARVCHPREDHLVPLFVALGAAGSDSATRFYHEAKLMGGFTASSYQFS
jgi:aromatic ring-opening dioxygenase catalytic subunit (LigB family)